MTRTLNIEGTGTRVQYRILASGPIVASEEGNATINSDDHVNGYAATGVVVGGTDELKIEGEIVLTHFTNFNSLIVELDGVKMTNEKFGLFDSPTNNYTFESQAIDESKPEAEPDNPTNDVVDTVKPSNTGVDCGISPTPNTENAIRTSSVGGVQKAINQAESKNINVIVDEHYETNSEIKLKSGVSLIGEGGSIFSKGYIGLNVHNTQNVTIHNMSIEAEVGNTLPRGLIGYGDGISVENLTISDCTLHGGRNGMWLGGAEKNNNISGVTVKHCDISETYRHGLYSAINEGNETQSSGILENVRYINNYIHNITTWMGATIAGLDYAPAERNEIFGNLIDFSMQDGSTRSGSSTKNDNWCNHGIVLEDWVTDTKVKYNVVINAQKSGIGCSAEANNNEWVANKTKNCKQGIRAVGKASNTEHRPRDSLFKDNECLDNTKWAVYNMRTGGGNVFKNNLFTGSHNIADEEMDEFIDNTYIKN